MSDTKWLRAYGLWEARLAGDRRIFRLLYAKRHGDALLVGLLFTAKKSKRLRPAQFAAAVQRLADWDQRQADRKLFALISRITDTGAMDDSDERLDFLEISGHDPDSREAVEAGEDFDEFANLIDALVSVRKSSGITQRAVAEVLETTQSAVSEIERIGGNPTIRTLQRYARAVGCELKLRAKPTVILRKPANAEILRTARKETFDIPIEEVVGGIRQDRPQTR